MSYPTGFKTLKKDVIGYKIICDAVGRNYLVTLLIPAGTLMYSNRFRSLELSGRRWSKRSDGKIRAPAALVLEIQRCRVGRYESSANLGVKRCRPETSFFEAITHCSQYAPSAWRDTEYKVDEYVIAYNWTNEGCSCGGGIHFCASKRAAMSYYGRPEFIAHSCGVRSCRLKHEVPNV